MDNIAIHNGVYYNLDRVDYLYFKGDREIVIVMGSNNSYLLFETEDEAKYFVSSITGRHRH